MLKTFVKSLDDLDEAVRSFYSETDTGFVLDAEPTDGYEVANTAGLKSALEKERSERASLKKQLAKYSDLDPEKYSEALKRLEELDNKGTQNKALDSKLAEQKELFEAELKKANESRDKVMGQLERSMIYQSAAEEIMKRGGNATLLMPHILNQTKMIQADDGTYKVAVIDPKTGNPRIGDNSGNDMSVGQLVESMYNDAEYAGAFPGNGSSGSGARGSHAADKANPNKTLSSDRFSKMNPAEKMKFIKGGGTVTTND